MFDAAAIARDSNSMPNGGSPDISETEPNGAGEKVRVRPYKASVTATLNASAKSQEDRRTYIITGNGRGGTTMVAGVAQILGLDLNPTKTFNLEDASFALVAQGINPEKGKESEKLTLTATELVKNLRDNVARRNDSQLVWGWKDPSVEEYLSDIYSDLRNPHLIIVWRDPAAVATAMMAVNYLDTYEAFRVVLDRYMRYLQLARELRCPTLMVSYERSRLDPDQLAADLAEFLGMNLDEEKLAEIRKFVSPQGGYLDDAKKSTETPQETLSGVQERSFQQLVQRTQQFSETLGYLTDKTEHIDELLQYLATKIEHDHNLLI